MSSAQDSKPRHLRYAVISGTVSGLVRAAIAWLADHFGF